MTIPLLTTKLYVPPLRPNLVPRPRLIERLEEGRRQGHRLTLISAPAGFGKTTLLSEWIAGEDRLVAWLSLDEADNDPVRFWAYVVAALHTVPGFAEADIGEEAVAMFKSSQPVPIEAVLTTLINEVMASAPASDVPFLLVLDDLHLIETQPIHQGLAFFLEHLPPQMHLVITTRVDPPLPLARLRARAQMTELRMEDLRFMPDEAAAFLNQAAGLSLSPAVVAALEERMEGWIAGLQMAALALRGRLALRGPLALPGQEVDGFAEALAGGSRYVLDYLLEEVLNREPEHVRVFLLQTSILDRLSGPLCNAVCLGSKTEAGENDGDTALARLQRANLFIVPLDYEGRWYRYHRLFADLLRKQLVKSQPEILPALHRRAGEWYEQNGFPSEAVDHALVAQDVERAARLVERAAPDVLDRGEVSTFVSWLEALSDEAIRSRPWLCVFHAWMLIVGGQEEAIESRLADVKEALEALELPDEEVDRIRGYVSSIRAHVAFIRGAVFTTVECAYDALEKLSEADHSMRATTAMILGAAQGFIGDFAAAAQSFEEARAIAQASGNHFSVMLASSALAQLEVVRGHLLKAERIYRDALRLVEKPVRQWRSPGVGYACVGLAGVLCEWNVLAEAARYAEEGVASCKILGQAEILMPSYVALARVQRARGDINGAIATLQEARQMASEMSTWSVDTVAIHQARLWLAQGDLDAASRWAQQSRLSVDDALSFHLEAGHLTLARVLIAQGELDRASGLLTRLLEAAESSGRWGSVIEILILQALILYKQAETDQALLALERALSLAEPEGYVRIFADEGESMAALLQEAASQRILPEYVGRLLAASGVSEDWSMEEIRQLPYVPPPIAQPLVDPLSARELEVLRFVAAGLSNPEIAEQLYVSVNTIKAHTKSIYRKLDVHNRTQAVSRARELELL
jgi:LuxR family maltose regulon positive regulatory protein